MTDSMIACPRSSWAGSNPDLTGVDRGWESHIGGCSPERERDSVGTAGLSLPLSTVTPLVSLCAAAKLSRTMAKRREALAD